MASDPGNAKPSLFLTVTSSPIRPVSLPPTLTAQTNENEPEAGGTTTDDDDDYNGFPWNENKSFAKCSHLKGNWNSWVWEYGFRLQEIKTQHVYWFCRLCVQRKARPPARYLHSAGTGNMHRHLELKHHIGKDGPIRKKRRLEGFQRSSESPLQAHINRNVDSFNPTRFKRALIRWMAYSNIAFVQVENEPFRRMMLEGNSSLDRSGCLPSANGAKAWIFNDFKTYFDVAKEVLDFKWPVHFTFDLWTAGNLICLNGVLAHWLDAEGRKRKLLLSLPSIDESHTGEAIAGGVAQIIKEFGLQDRIGYFVLDNAANCTTAIESLAEIFGFDPLKRRLRCTAHIINLVARQIMYGTDLTAFEDEHDVRQLQDDLEIWRRKGALGKLRNIICWITDKHADGGRMRQFQKIQAEQPPLDDDLKPPSLKRPNDTRWNSHYFAIEAAVANRASIDDFSLTERQKYTRLLQQVREKNARVPNKKQQKEPAESVIVRDALTEEDWVMIKHYMEILKPLMLATKRLEGHPKSGRNGAMWEVLPIYESLLSKLEEFKARFETLSGKGDEFCNHLVVNIQLGWQKLDEYYAKLEDSIVYASAFLLHPRFRWAKLKHMWRLHPDWIKMAEDAFDKLWQDYKQLDLGEKEQAPPAQKEPHVDFLEEFLQEQDVCGVSEPMLNTQEGAQRQPDEMADFMNAADSYFASVQDPIAFWVSPQHRWPRVARMALDIYGIPPTEADNERLYSEAGDMITKKRHGLKANIIGAVQCLRQWDRDDIIDWR